MKNREIKKYIFLTYALLFLGYCNVYSNIHFIISFDQLVGTYNKYDASILQKLDNTLLKHGFDRNTDYVSVFAYGLDWINPNMNTFVQPCKDRKGEKLVWQRVPKDKSLYKLMSDGSRNVGLPPMNYSSLSGSMQTIAKEYTLSATLSYQSSQIGVPEKLSMKLNADTTYVLLVSDMWFNGSNDYEMEWRSSVSSIPYSLKHKMNSLEKEVFNHVSKVKKNYNFTQIDTINLDTTNKRPYTISVFDVVPNERPSVHSVTNLPSPIPLKRIRGGFMVDLDVAVNSLANYRIKELYLYENKTKKILCRTDRGKVNVKISRNDIAIGDTICLGMALKLIDNCYNGAIISASNERFREGMTIKQAVTVPDEAKVMGIFPLGDLMWWLYPNDVFNAVLFWDLIIIFISFVTICLLFYKWFINVNMYKPSNEKIKIRKIK